jgi:hypothetical protein
MSTTSSDWSPQLQEALWDAGKQFGVRLEVRQQVAIARSISRRRREDVSTSDVSDAFAEVGLARPSKAFAETVLSLITDEIDTKTLLDVLLDYRQFAIEALSPQFGGRTQGKEEELRNNLRTYLPERGYAEARAGRGRTDILLPPPEDAIIEVKVWTSMQYYEDGLVELGRYIHTQSPKQAFMVVFCDREPLPSFVSDHAQTIAEKRSLEGLVVPVVVVAFEVDAPSKAARAERRRTRRGE